MRTLMVSYDLNSPEQNYPDLIKWLRSYPSRWHELDSFWLIVTDQSPSRVRDLLRQFIDANDELLVIEVTGATWSSWGFTDEANRWLNRHVAA